MDSLQKEAVKRYAQLAKSERDPSASVGRKEIDKGKDQAIWEDILIKFQPKKGGSILDIGSGYGGVTELCLKEGKNNNWDLTLFDIPEVAEALNEHLANLLYENTQIVGGVYPYEVEESFFSRKV